LRGTVAKALERKELSREVVRLLGDISHEIKNLLMPVVCGAELLESEIHELVERLPEMDAVKAQASHKLCDQVIAMLRDTAGRIQERTKEIADYMKGVGGVPQFGPCSIAGVVAGVFKTLRLVAEEKGILFCDEGLSALPVIRADAQRLYTAFYNLVNNALAEVPVGGSIIVRGEDHQDRQEVWLWVSDTGGGMPPEVRATLFTMHTISLKADGTGLGTRIVKDVIEVHGGQISVDSQQGHGSTFSIRLPYRPPEIQAREGTG
jgi:signal transduction histidine kinase